MSNNSSYRNKSKYSNNNNYINNSNKSNNYNIIYIIIIIRRMYLYSASIQLPAQERFYE